MTLLDAVLTCKAQSRLLIVSAVVVVILLASLAWIYHQPGEHGVDSQRQDYEGAYGIYFHDADWRQHQQVFSIHTAVRFFYRDWGPRRVGPESKSHPASYGSANTQSFGGGG